MRFFFIQFNSAVQHSDFFRSKLNEIDSSSIFISIPSFSSPEKNIFNQPTNQNVHPHLHPPQLLQRLSKHQRRIPAKLQRLLHRLSEKQHQIRRPQAKRARASIPNGMGSLLRIPNPSSRQTTTTSTPNQLSQNVHFHFFLLFLHRIHLLPGLRQEGLVVGEAGCQGSP